MSQAFFQVRLTVRPAGGGAAGFVLPKIFEGLDCRFVVVKEGGEEGIVRVDAPDAVLKKVEKDKDCTRLTATSLEALKKSYPPPNLKEKYRTQTASEAAGGALPAGIAFALDSSGNRIVEMVQTVRAGFYLIDVPVVPG